MRKQVDEVMMILADVEEIIHSNLALMEEALLHFYATTNDMTRMRIISYKKMSEMALKEVTGAMEKLDDLFVE